MTREEAKALLLNISAYDIDTKKVAKQEAIEMAIKALEAQAEPTDEQIKEYCRKRCLTLITNEFMAHIIADNGQAIRSKPSAEPQTGHWIWQTEDIYKCSECGEDIHVKEVMNVPQYVCCPMCGARMIEPQESEDKE